MGVRSEFRNSRYGWGLGRRFLILVLWLFYRGYEVIFFIIILWVREGWKIEV